MADPSVETDIACAEIMYGQAKTDDERAEIIAALLSDWYAAWPPTSLIDPHEPIATVLVRVIGGHPHPGESNA